MLDLLNTRSSIPEDLGSVTTVAEHEIRPRSVGVSRAGIEAIWNAVETLYTTGIHPALQICVRRNGEVVLDRAIGHLSGNGPQDGPEAAKKLATTDTPFNIFSASKAVTAMVIHYLDQENKLRLDDRVAEYIPEFGKHGKDAITLRHVLTHRAGIPSIPPEAMQLDNIENREEIVRIFAETELDSPPGRILAYHALSGGFILGEVVRRITGKDIRKVLEQKILKPLGFRWMRYGVKKKDVPKVALSYNTGPPQIPLIPYAISRAIGVDPRDATEMSNDPRYMTGIVPAGNVISTANELSRFFQLLLNGGELDGVRVFDKRTVQRATLEESYLEFDAMLGFPIRYGQGFMLGGRYLSLYGPDTEHAYGHLGFTNVVAWADPERQVAASVMTSGKPLLHFELYYLHEVLRQIGLACPKIRD